MTQCSKEPAEAPVAKKIAKELTAHGDTRIDNYYWMNQRDDDEVIAHLNAENDYTDKMMKHTEKLQKKLYKEMVSRIKQDDETVPYKENGYCPRCVRTAWSEAYFYDAGRGQFLCGGGVFCAAAYPCYRSVMSLDQDQKRNALHQDL